MKKEKNAIYYRNMLHKDTIILLIIAILFGITSFLMEGFGIFLKSVLFIIFYIVLICNKKENKSFIGIIAIITGTLMVLTSLIDASLFGIVYILLGIFYIVHSIMYLMKLKNEPSNLEQQVENKSKMPYLNLGLIIVSIISFLASIKFLGQDKGLVFLAINVGTLLFVLISSIILMVKKYKSVLLYITFVISIICSICSALLLTIIMPNVIEEYKYKNSDEYILDMLNEVEEKFASDVSELSSEAIVSQPSNEKDSYVIINKKSYEEAIPLWNNKGYTKMTSVYDNKKLENITCDGYVEVRLNYEGYEECLMEYASYDVKESICQTRLHDYESKAYIKCSGNYSYSTEGFDATKLREADEK